MWMLFFYIDMGLLIQEYKLEEEDSGSGKRLFVIGEFDGGDISVFWRRKLSAALHVVVGHVANPFHLSPARATSRAPHRLPSRPLPLRYERGLSLSYIRGARRGFVCLVRGRL